MTAAAALGAASAGRETVRRVLACALLRAGRCDPAVAGELVSRVRLEWNPAEPEEVVLTAAGPLRWYLDPGVLIDGLHVPSAEGGVFVAPLPAPALISVPIGKYAAPGSAMSQRAELAEPRHDIVLDPGHDRVALQVRTRDLAGFVAAITGGTCPQAGDPVAGGAR